VNYPFNQLWYDVMFSSKDSQINNI